MRGNSSESFRTYSGRHLWPLDPRAEDIDLVDIAHALARINRFNGHTGVPYSVAEHAVRVSRLVEHLACGFHGPVPHAPDCSRREVGGACTCGSVDAARGDLGVMALALWGLHHDDSEYLLVDLPHPIKHAEGLGTAYLEAERRLMTCVCRHFSLPLREPYLVSVADRVMLWVEQRDLMNAGARDRCACAPFTALADSLPGLLPGTYAQAEQSFIQRHRDLTTPTRGFETDSLTGTAPPAGDPESRKGTGA
jgi:hypothetical protein